jgi:16S rRNA (guanine527-N7)-methyltransferase
MNPLWNTLASRANVTLSDAQHARLSQYLDLLTAANERMNLTRITDRAAAELQHIADALTLLPHLPAVAEGASPTIADVGSGGGVPGLPLAIARPDAKITLIEATKKKAAFLKEAAAALDLSNVTVLDTRAEDVGQDPATREKFDVAVARAVATIDWLAEWCLPLVRKHGRVLLMKGPKHLEELPIALKPIRFLGGGVSVVHPVAELPGADHLVIVEIPKVRLTDRRYPRAATATKGNPVRG